MSSPQHAQRSLTAIWFCCAAPVTAILAFTTLTGKLLDPAAVWQWYARLVTPTLLLMLSTLRAPVAAADASGRFYYRLCIGLSVAYWLYLYSIVGAALVSDPETVAAVLEKSTIGLVIVQGLVSYALGAYFTSAKAPSDASADA